MCSREDSHPPELDLEIPSVLILIIDVKLVQAIHTIKSCGYKYDEPAKPVSFSFTKESSKCTILYTYYALASPLM